ncbi:type IV pilin protein [Myxosarcina sp. GI1]|uniref:type IV pilin protein n=1 Tax=Myxosarcina sp. GI1 TaxID=1541065 RepID=UPI00055AECC6|nr:type IV pilin-like G/H family protein [Myxosarcina sp. GI1]
MNSVFTAKLLQNLRNKKANKGFTLIELLVVVIIIGVLAAVALPNLLGQVAKGRQAEAKNNLGAINRTQQAERLETGTFQTLANLPITVSGDNYNYADDGTPDAVQASQTATAVATYENDILDYTAAVNQQSNGTVVTIICESDAVNGSTGAISVTAGTATTAPTCGTGSSEL